MSEAETPSSAVLGHRHVCELCLVEALLSLGGGVVSRHRGVRRHE
jgi:hypothetical protein